MENSEKIHINSNDTARGPTRYGFTTEVPVLPRL